MRQPRNPWKKMISNLKTSAKRNFKTGALGKKVYDITWEDLKAQYDAQGGRCFWLGIKINPLRIYDAWHSLAPSIDRLDNSKHYTKDNIVIVVRFANLGRGRLPVADFVEHCTEMRKSISNEMWPKFLYESDESIKKLMEARDVARNRDTGLQFTLI